MFFSKIGNAIKTGTVAVCRGIKRHSSEICLYGGMAMTAGATVWIGIVSKKAHVILETAKMVMQEAENIPDKKARKKAILEAKKEAAKELAKLYIVPVSIDIAGYGLIYSSHVMVKSQLAIVEAAYIALDKMYGEYRERVADQVGVQKEDEIYSGQVYDELGNLVKDYGGPATPFTIYFKKYRDNGKRNPLWNDDPIETLANLCRAESDLQRLYNTNGGHIFVNEVLKKLYLKPTKEGQILGVGGGGDGTFTLNIPRAGSPRFESFLGGDEDGLVLSLGVVTPVIEELPTISEVNAE